jgi:hypothetical protein
MTTKKIKDEIEGKKRKGNEKNGGGWIKKKKLQYSYMNNEGKKTLWPNFLLILDIKSNRVRVILT